MIAKINLLPWREEFRNEKRVEFFRIIGVVVVAAAVIALGWDRFVVAKIDNQNARNNVLNQKIAELDVKVQEIAALKLRRQQLIDRMTVIQALQSNRPEIVRIFDEMVSSIPEGVYLTTLSRGGPAIAFTGVAESNNRVSTYMRNLEQSYKFADPNLTRVLADDRLGDQGNTFDMRIRITDPVVVASPEGAQ
jgi:type IV pilus assembly protein PilN